MTRLRAISTVALLALIHVKVFAETLPYAVRTKPFQTYSTGVRGDIRTIGMAGATVGLGDTFLAASDNPAGLAMTLNQGDDNFTYTRVQDARVQPYDQIIETFNGGLALNTYPWGFSVGTLVPYRESANYEVIGNPGNSANFDIHTQEFQVSIARVFLEDRLSLGVAIQLVKVYSSIEFRSDPIVGPKTAEHSSTSANLVVGGMVQLDHRLIFGASFKPSLSFAEGNRENLNSPVPGFFQEVLSPEIAGVGLGWIPNRFLRADFSTFLVGSTKQTALLRNEAALVGEKWSLQPRVGLAYVFADFKNLRGTLFLGTYLESSRIQASSDRLHPTFGTEVKPWIFNLGVGIDTSLDYRNYVASLSIDFIKVIEQLSWIKSSREPPMGLLPNPFFMSDRGLPRTLTADWRDESNEPNALEQGLSIPSKIGNSVDSMTGSSSKGFGQKALDVIISIPKTIGQEFEEMKKAQDRTGVQPGVKLKEEPHPVGSKKQVRLKKMKSKKK